MLQACQFQDQAPKQSKQNKTMMRQTRKCHSSISRRRDKRSGIEIEVERIHLYWFTIYSWVSRSQYKVLFPRVQLQHIFNWVN